MEDRQRRIISLARGWIRLSPRSTSWTTALLVVLLIAFLIGLGMANARFTESAQDPNEFLPRWEGAHAWLAEGLSPYDPQVSLSVQRRLYGREAVPEQGEDLGLVVLPLPSMFLYIPWGLLDYPAARAGWMTLLEVMLVVAGVLTLRLASWRPPAMLLALLVAFGVAWSPGIRSIVAGHTAILALASSLAALACIERGWDVAAGILLATAMADPIVGLIVLVAGVVWAASRRRWRIVGAALVTAGVLVAVPLLLMPGWPLAWLQQIATAIQVQREFSMGWGLLSQGARRASVILASLLVLAAAWVLWTCLGKGTRWLLWSVASLLVLGTWLTTLVIEASLLDLPAPGRVARPGDCGTAKSQGRQLDRCHGGAGARPGIMGPVPVCFPGNGWWDRRRVHWAGTGLHRLALGALVGDARGGGKALGV